MTKLENLLTAIKNGTYDLEKNHEIGVDGQGRAVLTVDFNVEDEPIDFIAFNGLVSAYDCIIIQVFSGSDFHVQFSIEEKLPEGY